MQEEVIGYVFAYGGARKDEEEFASMLDENSLRILLAMKRAPHDAYTVAYLARTLGLTEATVQRHCDLLKKDGYVAQPGQLILPAFVLTTLGIEAAGSE